MNCELKPQATAKLLNLNLSNEPEQQPASLPVSGSAEDTQLLLQKLSINNPFYRFRKRSNSLREQPQRPRPNWRRHRSEADLRPKRAAAKATAKLPPLLPHAYAYSHQHNEAKVVVVLDNKQQLAISNPRYAKTRSVSSLTAQSDNSTVITNPFSIFHDDEILTLGVNPRLRCANNATLRPAPRPAQRGSKGLRRLFDRPTIGAAAAAAATASNPHYLQGVPVCRFERQDFNAETLEPAADKSRPKLSKAIFKQLSLRRLHKPEPPPGSLPKLKLSYRYPNRTQSIQSMRLAGSGGYDVQHTALRPRLLASSAPSKSNYFERLQAKTRQGIQKIKDKCRNFKTASDASCGSSSNELSGFHTLVKDESFRFIGDQANISNYESRCAAAHAAGKQATIYKSYKSEIDLSKNLHYLEHYLEQNFEQQLSSSKQSTQSVGRIPGAQRQALAKRALAETAAAETPQRRRHKRSASQAQKQAYPNYENLGTLPLKAAAAAATTKRNALHSDSLSSSDYASVFSGPTTQQRTPKQQQQQQQQATTNKEQQQQQDEHLVKLRYEHPDKMCEYYFDNLSSYALALEQSEDLLLAESASSTRFLYDDDNDDDDDDDDDDELELAADAAAATAAAVTPSGMRDMRIRVNMNECVEPEPEWYRGQEQAMRSYHENLAENNFYESLNQHLQRQASELDGHGQATGERHKSVAHTLSGESYLAHFQRSRSDFERAERHNDELEQLYAGDEYFGFVGGNDNLETVSATKQRRADLMEAHYAARGYQAGSSSSSRSKRAMPHAALANYKRSQPHPMPSRVERAHGVLQPTVAAGGDVLYATSSKQQQPQLRAEITAATAAAAITPTAAAATTITAATTAAAAAATGEANAALGATLSVENANTNRSLTNRYMLENLRKYYANQQQHPPAHSVNSSSLSNSSSSNSSMSQQQKLLLPSAQQPQVLLAKQQQQQHQQHHLVARRNSSTSNASSTVDNFDTFIALRNATATASATPTLPQQPPQRRSVSNAPLSSTLNYYGAVGNPYSGNKLTAAAMLSQVNSARVTSTATSSNLLLHQQHSMSTASATPAAAAAAAAATKPTAGNVENETFILEYEC
ncbi:CG31462 [Drosophila busckii]|uniref:CG31462 n=1 Tax=Drosophila busckii TaxID=30019 RepID=A0A0M4F7D5_DROBS|nr:CG31462 [Drosophila busckii]